MREEEHVEHHLHDPEECEVDVELDLERRDVLANLEKTQQAQQAEEAQEAEVAESGVVTREREVDELDGKGRGRVDPEPAAQVMESDLAAVGDPSLVLRREGQEQRPSSREEDASA